MLRFLARRALGVIPLIFVVSFIVFLMLNIIPGDRARFLAGETQDPERIAAIREQLHLDKSVIEQYVIWLGDAVRGDLGRSLVYEDDVVDMILPRATATASLTIFAFTFAVIGATIVAVVGALLAGRSLDRLLSALAAVAVSIPPFWLAMMLVLWFSIERSWFPAIGYAPVADGYWEWAKHLILPALALGLAPAAELMLQMRASLDEVLHRDYILSARAKGLGRFRVVCQHALKNAAGPVVTVLGTRFTQLIAGAVTVEIVFAFQGLGRLAVDATFGRDVPLLLGMVILTTLIVAIVNMLVDVSYGYFNPRVRQS